MSVCTLGTRQAPFLPDLQGSRQRTKLLSPALQGISTHQAGTLDHTLNTWEAPGALQLPEDTMSLVIRNHRQGSSHIRVASEERTQAGKISAPTKVKSRSMEEGLPTPAVRGGLPGEATLND